MAKIIIEGPEFFLQRRKEKEAARASDKARIDAGEDPAKIGWENSIVSPEFFKGAKIKNLAETVGQ